MKIFENEIFQKKDGKLYFDGQDLTQLAKVYGTPLYVFSEREIKNNVKEIMDTFHKYQRRLAIHYAAKCESTIANLQAVKAAGSDLEVNSGGELYKGLYAGFRGNQIVFNGVGKTVAEIEMAIENDIKSINVDSEFELNRIVAAAKKLGKVANVTIRVVPEVSTGVVKGNETGTHESKFGITLDVLEDVMKYAISRTELNVIGYHMHIGTQTYDLQSFMDSFQVLIEVAIEMHRKTGYTPKVLNIGGGLPVPHYIEDSECPDMPENIYKMLKGDLPIDTIAREVCEVFEPHNVEKWAGVEYRHFFKEVELILEAGRKVVASSAVLLSKVENEKVRKMIGEYWITVDAGFNTLMEVKTYYWYYHMVCANKVDELHNKAFRVAGPCCDSGDVYYDIDNHINLPDYRSLPASTKPGDLIAMVNVGAYGTPNMSNYNGRPKAGVVQIRENGEVVIIKPAQTYEDLVSDEIKL